MPPRGKRSAPEPVQPRRGKALKGIEPEPVPAELGVNAEIQAALSKCDDIILEKWSKGILTDQPTALSGVPEYNAARAKAALDGGNKYTASVPLYWLNLKFEMQPGVPRYRSRIDSLEKHFFESPAHMMAPLTVCLNSGEYPHECIGALNPVDPSELRDALRQAVASAITDKQPAATLRKWRDVLMSTVVEFEVMDDKNRIQKTFSTIVQRREDIGVWHENTRVTSLLRIYEVMDLKRQLEDVSGKQNKKSLAAHYERIKYCQKSEQVTVGWVEVAQMLHGCALQNPVVLKVLTSFDQLPSNPIDTVYKMREICVQSDKRPDHMEWSFVMLWDWWTNCEGCEISQRELKEGSRYPVSLIRLFLAKKSLRDWLWRNMESNFMWESTVKQSIRDVTKDLPTMRRHFGFYDDPSAQVAFADRGSWPESADLYVQLFEAVVYGYRFDHHLGQSLKNHKTADDVFNHSDVKPMMSKVLAAYEKETGSTPDTVEEEVPLDVQTLLAADNVHLSLPESLIKAAEESPGGKDFEGCAAVEAGVRAAQRRVQGQIQLIVDCDEGLADLLRETKAAQMTGDPEAKSYVAVVFDGKVACESGSQAKYRLPPLSQPQLKRLVGAYLALRDGELADGDVFVMLDGGKGPTFEDSVTKVVGKKLQASKTTVVYTFESCEARLERASKQTLDMVETVSMPTHDGFSAKVQPRLFSESNTRGNAIAGLARPQWTDAKAVWNVSMAQKRSILGPTNMPLPGGACPVEHEQESKVKDSDVVPAFYHESPHTLTAELGHYLCVRAIIDLTPGSGHWAAWSVRKRVPYAGVCMTEKHAELLTKRLVTKTVEAMMDPNDEDLYDSAYTALIEKLQGANNQQGVTEAQNQGKGKGRGGRGGRGGKGTGKQRGVQQQDGGAGAADEASSGSGGLSRDELLKKITEAAAAGAADDA